MVPSAGAETIWVQQGVVMIDKTVSYPRRQQLRRLARAGALGAGALLAAALALLALNVGAGVPAAVLLLAAVGLTIASRHWFSLAARAGVGARSEANVQRTLAALEREGWRIRHSLDWQGPGDIDSVAIARPGSRSRSRPRPAATRPNISRASPAWPAGCTRDVGAGAPTARSLSCASQTPARSTTPKTAC